MTLCVVCAPSVGTRIKLIFVSQRRHIRTTQFSASWGVQSCYSTICMYNNEAELGTIHRTQLIPYVHSIAGNAIVSVFRSYTHFGMSSSDVALHAQNRMQHIYPYRPFVTQDSFSNLLRLYQGVLITTSRSDCNYPLPIYVSYSDCICSGHL